jgi:hypothetical protein
MVDGRSATDVAVASVPVVLTDGGFAAALASASYVVVLTDRGATAPLASDSSGDVLNSVLTDGGSRSLGICLFHCITSMLTDEGADVLLGGKAGGEG